MEIGERLKKLRIKRKLTQFEVEELTGINRSTLSLYELGIRVPPIDKTWIDNVLMESCY